MYLNASTGLSLDALIAGYIPDIIPTKKHKKTDPNAQNFGKINIPFINIETTFPIAIPIKIPIIPPMKFPPIMLAILPRIWRTGTTRSKVLE